MSIKDLERIHTVHDRLLSRRETIPYPQNDATCPANSMREMNMEKLAVISDIHGNRWALEAVMKDAEAHGIKRYVNLGDVFYGPLDPLGTARMLIQLDFPTVMGNEDRILVEPTPSPSPTLRFVRSQLEDSHLDWLGSLPTTIHLDNMDCFHASPVSDSTYLLWDVQPNRVLLRQTLEIAKDTDHLNASLILCGHDHVPRTLSLPHDRLVINPGSVGLPAYQDDSPHLHVMEAGSPHARYAIVEGTLSGWSVSHRCVPYDWQAAAAAAEARGRKDWASWLRTGRALTE